MKLTSSGSRSDRAASVAWQRVLLVALCFPLLLPVSLSAQATNIAIGSTVIQPSVKRLGINLGSLTNYDSGQMLKNLIIENPGFEGQIWNATVRCSSGTATSCVDENQYSGWPPSFWNGATYQFFYGAAAGRSGTVTYSSAPNYGVGGTFFFGDSNVTPAAGDYMIVRLNIPGGSTGGWFPSLYGAGTVTDNLTDLPPGTQGKQTTVLTAPSSNDLAILSNYFDGTAGISFVQLNGTYQLQFKAKGLSGSNQVGIQLVRAGVATYINQTVNLTNGWNTYNLTFSAAENGTAVGTVGLSFSTVYGADSFELDDVSLTQTNGDPSNPTVFRDAVVNTLRTLQPGILRDWGGNQLGETLDNLLTPRFGRQRAGYSEYYSVSEQTDYGLHDFMVLCQTIGAEPWFVVPSTFTTTDAANLIEYLAGSATTTTYGAKRAALGQTTPWTQVFPKIHLEFGNEEWNSTFEGGSILYPAPYGSQAQTIFAAMQNDASYVPGVFDFVLGGQAGGPGLNSQILSFCNNNTSFTIGPYTMNTVDSYTTNELLFGSTFAEPEAYMSGASTTSAEGLSPGMVYQDYQDVQQSGHPVPLSFYEINMSTLGGAITSDQAALNSYTPSLGAGLMVADTMLQGMQQFGVVNQSLFALPQYSFSIQTPGGQTDNILLWGSVIDMGVTNRKRPQFLAEALANQALSSGAAMLQTVQSGSNPTWNEALTNTVQFTNAHYIQSYAFQQGTNMSAVVFNLSRTSALPVTFSGVNAPAGTVLVQQMTSANPTDTNENSNVIVPTSTAMTNFSSASGLSLPPYSLTVLTWSTSSGAPVISSVNATGLTTTSATITWTTDEPSSSLVNYGTAPSYGSSSTLNSTLTTSHSVTLTGLTAGTTYNYDVTSANSASPALSSTSTNYTFSTPLPAPVISGITVTNITPTSVTVNWTTDQSSTSQVAYGTTGNYEFITSSSALTANHSLTITGLLGGTTYGYVITSANSTGSPASSATLAFSTLAAPVISGVTISNIGINSATITWTTDQASTSQVFYGLTTAYGASTTATASLVNVHSVTLTGLTGNTTYNFSVLSADAYGLSSTSANYSFVTVVQGPIVSYVTSASITNTSATINWTTDQASSSQVQYGTSAAYGSSSTLSSALVNSHSVTLTGLTLGTTYDYAVVSANSTGVTTTSANFTFTTTGGSTTTNVAIGSTILQPSVKRLGINLGVLNNYDSGQLTKNLITMNPSFQGQIWNTIIQCGSGTAASCTDANLYSSWPAGFWNSATYQFFYGAAAGRSGTVYNSTAAGNGQGATLNFVDSGVVPQPGDYVVVRKNMPGNSIGGWFASTSSAASVTDNLTDLPPGSADTQTITLNAPGSSDYVQLSTVFDHTSGISFIQLNGTYQVQFKAKGLGGSNQVGVQLQRSGVGTYLNQTVALTNSWNTYTLTFTAAENGSAVGEVALAFNTVYGTDYFELADVSLTQSNGDPTNPTVFRDPVVSALRTLQPGILRYWGGNGQLGETLNNLLTPQFGRQRAGYSAYSAQSTQVDYGLHDFLVLCQTLGAEPWFVVPITFSTTDAANLIEYLAGSASTPYGAKRAALGQTTPWTQVFSTIHLEFGEEPWSTSFQGGSILNPVAYGQQAQAIFAAMQADASYVAGSFDFVLEGQASNPANNTIVQNNCNNNTSFDVAPYLMNTVNSYSTNEQLFGSTFAEPEALMSNSTADSSAEGLTPGQVYQDYQAIQSSTHPVPLSFYEMNLSTLGGSITQAALNSYVSSLGAGLAVADTMLQGLQQYGIVNQNLFALPQYEYTRSDGSTTYLFGSVVDMGNSNRKRPQYLALELANQALSAGAAMLQTTQSGANPTWDEPLTNSVYQNGAHYVQSYAFSNGNNYSTILFNLSRTSALPVTFSGANAPTGTVQMQQLTSANPTDNNESASVVGITTSTLPSFNDATGLSLPPYSMTVLSWSTSTSAPTITGVTAGSLSSTAATISWTTDQASTSQVSYGTTAAYGSSASGSASLVTSHSVALTGLTPGTTYDYDVTSANASGSASSSVNYSFTTPLAAPVISAISVGTITGTSATISWTTDQASTSQVAYGPTTAYGQTSQSSTLTMNHSVTLNGLVAGTTYNFDVTSANSAGTSSTSANSTFATPSSGSLSISAVTVTSITSSSALVTWTTSVASSSQVNYGTSTAYGSSSALSAALVTNHSVTLTGLAAGTTYDFDVASAPSGGSAVTSPNSSFATLAGTPVISAVTVTSITATSAIVSWTTDQATSSQVNYGTTTGYGTFSPLNSSLVMNHSVTLTGLTASTTYDFDVVSANSAGTTATSPNSTFATLAGTPVISAVTVSSITATSAIVSWTTDQPTSSLVNYGTTASYGTSSALNSSLATNHSVTLTGLTASTTYDFDVVSANSAGTTATSPNSTFATLAGTPVISAVTVSSITATSAIVSWTTDQATSSLVNYGTTTAYGTSSPLNSSLVTNHSVTLTGLTANTPYDFDVVSANSAGTTATSPNSTFATAALPVITAVNVSTITATSAIVSWTTNVAATSQVNYGTTTSYGTSSALNSSLVTNHSVTLTGLTASTTYDFDVVSANSAGISATSPNSTFATIAGTPVISAVTVNSITSTSAIITWTTDQSTSSLVNYGTSTSYGSSSTLSSTLVTNHSVTLTGLTAGTTYDFDVVSANSAGTSATSSNSTFATLAAAPVISAVTVTSITSTSAIVGWTTNIAATSQVNYGTTASYGSSSTLSSSLVTTHSVTLTGLTASTTYNFDVVSANSAGSSASSPNSTFATIAGTPVISAVTVSSITSTSAMVTWTTDQSTTSQVNYGTTTSYGSSSTLSSSLVTTHSVTLTGLTAGTTYDFDVVSANSAGTSATSPNSMFATLSASSSSAVYGGVDTTTQGAWMPVYGADGHYIPNDSTVTPSYATVSITGASLWTAASVTSDPRALTSTVGTGIASYYYGSPNFSFNVNFTDGNAHRIALYLLDWSGSAAVDTITIVDAKSSAVLSTQTYSSFHNGEYAIWNVQGNVIIQVTGTNPVVAGIFFGPAPAAATSAATYNATDTTTQGTWTGAYGADGYLIANDATNTPSYAKVTFNGSGLWTWASSTTSAQALQTASGATTRIASQYYGSPNYTINLNLTDGNTHKVSLYLLDWDNGGRAETIAIRDAATNVLLNVQTYSAFQNGQYASWNLKGNVIIQITCTSGSNATISGLFFGSGTSTSAPTISSVGVINITSTSATVTWTTNIAASSQVNYGTTTAYGTSSTLNSSLVTNHSVSLTGLTAGTTYDFDVSSATSGGAPATSPNSTFATLAAAPVISAVTVTNITASSAIVSWTTNIAATSQVNYGTTASYGSSSTLNSSLVTNHSVTLTGLTASTTYDFDVVSANSAGTTATSANSAFATIAGTPVISAVTVSSITSTSAIVTWTTDQSTSSLVNYGTSTSYGSSSTLSSTLVTNHSVTLTGLTAGTTYDFDVVSANSAGTSATSSNSTFATLAAAPVISAVTVTSITSTSAIVGWTTNIAATSQVNYGTTASYGSSSTLSSSLVTTHSVTLTGLTASTTYNFDVVSANSAGSSASSPNSTFATIAGTPVISAVTVSSITSTSAMVTWTTDQSTTSQVNYGTTTSYGSSSTLSSSLVTTHSVTLTGLTAGTTYDFDVVSANSAGTSATSPNSTFATLSASSSSAVYGGVDTTTEGAWMPVYGADGHYIPNDSTVTPSYATVSITGASLWTAASVTSDPRALTSTVGTGIASYYYGSPNFSFNVNFTDGNAHRIALYLLDWSGSAAVDTITIVDAKSSAVLSTQTYSSFHNGEYAIWNVQGNVIIQVTGTNPVVAGIFFGPAPAAATSAATYNATDTTTQGTWTGAYGADGYLIANDATNTPSYAKVTFNGSGLWTWASSTTSAQALQTASGATTRIASQYYGSPNYTINLNLTDGNTHKVSLYLLDWDNGGRAETIAIRDAATNVLLNVQTYSAFQNGQYASWNLKGNVIIQITCTSGSNATISGLFFK